MKKKQTFPWPGKYTFVDVEIPNIRNDSICAVSMIVIEDGHVRFRHTEKINPRSFFSGINMSIHHITPQDVQNARTFLDFWHQYSRYFTDEYILVGHNVLSDISVMDRDLERSMLQFPSGRYIDTMDLVMEEYYHHQTQKGDLKLDHIAAKMQIPLDHHNPASDVNACLEIFHYLYDHGFRNLDPYIHPIRLRSRTRNQPGGVRQVSRKKFQKDLSTRNFQPYFALEPGKKGDLHPYFDTVCLADLQKVWFQPYPQEQAESIRPEEDKIRAFVREIGGTVTDSLQEAFALIEFMIPGARRFEECRRYGVHLLHSLDVLDFIRCFEKGSESGSEELFRTIQQTLQAISSRQIPPMDLRQLVERGIDAYEAGDWHKAIWYLEMAAAQDCWHLRIYRLLADLYHKNGFYDEERRILKKGIRTARIRRKEHKDLQRRLDRIRGKEMKYEDS